MEWKILFGCFLWFALRLIESNHVNEDTYHIYIDMRDVYTSFLDIFLQDEVVQVMHSKWQSKIRIKTFDVISMDIIFHSEPLSLYSRMISSDCDLVTWTINLNDSYVGQVTCFWSLQTFDHCGSICRYPTIPHLQNVSDLSFLHFLSTLSLNAEDQRMEVDIIPFLHANSSRKLSSSHASSPSNPSLPTTPRPWTISSPQKLFSPNGQTYDNFGVSLGYHNDIAIVGAVTKDHGGRVYVYYREGNNFIQDPLLLTGYPPSVSPSASTTSTGPPTTSTHDYFGWSVDVFDRTVAVGAYHTLELTTEVQSVGAVYIFYQLMSGWNIEAFLRLHTPQQVNGKENRNAEVTITPKYDQFGWSLGLWDSTLVVGAYGDDDQGTSSGAAYIFERINNVRYHWTLTQKILPHDGSDYDNFGWSVAIYNNITIVGAYGDRNGQNQPHSGSVYLFQKYFLSTSTYSHWTQTQKLIPFDSYGNGFYGWSVDIWKDLIAVGSKSSTDSTISSNGVYIYRETNSIWNYETKLVPPSNRIIPNYGTSVSIYEESVLVGAHRDLVGVSPSSPPTISGSTQSGSAFMYTSQYQKDKTMNWVLLKELNSNSSIERNMKFGCSVSLYDDVLLIGAILGDGVMTDTGTVFVFIRSIDFSSLGHPLSGRTYFTLVLFLPLLFLGTCCVITFARIFMKPDDHSSGSTGGSSHDTSDDSIHSSSDYFHSSHQLVSETSSRGGGMMRDDEESIHSLAGLVRYQLLRSPQKR